MDNHIIKNEFKHKYKSYITYQCLLQNKEITQRTDIFKVKGCKCCSLTKSGNDSRLTHDEYLSKFNSVNINNEYTLLGKYKVASEKILIKHNICNNEYLIAPYHFLNGTKCGKCNNLNLTHNEFLLKFKDVYSDYIILDQFIKFNKKIKLQHKECNHIFYKTPDKFINCEQHCPKCSYSNSKMEALTEAYLIVNKIKYKREYTFNDCKYKNKLPFDFAIFDIENKLTNLIECDGEHHYDIRSKYYTDKVIIRDKIKTKYANDNKIALLRIRNIDKNIFFNILKDNIGGKKIPADSDIDNCYKKKINFTQATEIRVKYLFGKRSIELSKEYNVSITTIKTILNYKFFCDQDNDIRQNIILKLRR